MLVGELKLEKEMEMKKMKLCFAEGGCNHFVLAHAPEVLWEAIMS